MCRDELTYAAYYDDAFQGIGTAKELAEQLHVDTEYIHWAHTPTARKRHARLIVVNVDDGDPESIEHGLEAVETCRRGGLGTEVDYRVGVLMQLAEPAVRANAERRGLYEVWEVSGAHDCKVWELMMHALRHVPKARTFCRPGGDLDEA